MVPNLDEVRVLLKQYNQGEFLLLHGEVMAGILPSNTTWPT